MADSYKFFVGIDWGAEEHQVCLLDPARQIRGARGFAHSGPGLGALCDWLVQTAGVAAGELAVAIEVPRGPVVETLLERGFRVFALNPKQLDRFRDRHTVAGAKDDRRDAFVLADSLRTDVECFREVHVDDPAIIELRELSRVYDDLTTERGRLASQLRDLLLRYYPQLLRLSPGADERWLWNLLKAAPTPAAGARLRPKVVTNLLRAHRIRRLSEAEVLACLREPAVTVAPGTAEAASRHVALLLPRLALVDEQRRAVDQQIEHAVSSLAGEDAEGQTNEQRDVAILQSQPGLGSLGVATLLAEAREALTRRDYHDVRARAGVAPVTLQTGKQGKWTSHGQAPAKRRPIPVIMRRACSPRLRYAVFHWARVAVLKAPRHRAYYAALRDRGHSHPRALRSVGDRLLRHLMAMLKAGALFSLDHHQAIREAQGREAHA